MWLWDTMSIEKNKGNLEGINLGEKVKVEHRTFVILDEKILSIAVWPYQKTSGAYMKKQDNAEQT